MRSLLPITVGMLVVISSGTLQAQEPEVSVRAPEAVMVGDALRIELNATVADGDALAIPDQSFEPFELLDKTREQTIGADGRVGLSFVLELLALDAGEHLVGPISLRFTSKDGKLTDVEAEAIRVEVKSHLQNEPNAKLINKRTKPVSIEQDDYTLLWILGTLLAMALGGALTYLGVRWHRKRQTRALPPPPPPPPWEAALRHLRQLEQMRATMLNEKQTDVWVDSVSDTIRAYLGKRFGFDGLECTSDEIVSALGRVPNKGVQDVEVAHFLSDCDLVKFANAPLAEQASKDLLANAFQIVERTRGSIRPEATS